MDGGNVFRSLWPVEHCCHSAKRITHTIANCFVPKTCLPKEPHFTYTISIVLSPKGGCEMIPIYVQIFMLYLFMWVAKRVRQDLLEWNTHCAGRTSRRRWPNKQADTGSPKYSCSKQQTV